MSSSKIAFVVSGKSPTTIPGGLGAYAWNAAKILSQLGYKVFIVGFSSTEETVDLGFATLVHFRNPYSGLLGLGALLASKLFVREMEKVIQQEKPGEVVVYSAGIWGLAGVALGKSPMLRGIKFRSLVGYFTTHKHEFRGHILGAPAADYGIFANLFLRALALFARIVYSPIEARMLAQTDVIVVHYESVRNILLSEFKRLPPGKIAKIPFYIDLYERQSDVGVDAIKLDPNALPTISVICRQDPRKGINTFLKAVRLLKDRRVKFNCIVAGSGIYLRQNVKLAAKLGLADAVQFPGFVASTEKLLAATDVYVLPSVEEGSGAISLLEAMKKGVAIVTTYCDGIPEDFVHGETGLLVQPGDFTAMADELQRLVEDRGLRETLARNVKADYTRRFVFDRMKDGIAGLLSGRE